MGRPPKESLPPVLSELLLQVSRNIKYWRSEKNLTQKELSEKSKVSHTTLNQIETQHCRDIRLATLCSIAQALDVPVVALLERTNFGLSTKEQLKLLKASEALWKLAQKVKS